MHRIKLKCMFISRKCINLCKLVLSFKWSLFIMCQHNNCMRYFLLKFRIFLRYIFMYCLLIKRLNMC